MIHQDCERQNWSWAKIALNCTEQELRLPELITIVVEDFVALIRGMLSRCHIVISSSQYAAKRSTMKLLRLKKLGVSVQL